MAGCCKGSETSYLWLLHNGNFFDFISEVLGSHSHLPGEELAKKNPTALQMLPYVWWWQMDKPVHFRLQYVLTKVFKHKASWILPYLWDKELAPVRTFRRLAVNFPGEKQHSISLIKTPRFDTFNAGFGITFDEKVSKLRWWAQTNWCHVGKKPML